MAQHQTHKSLTVLLVELLGQGGLLDRKGLDLTLEHAHLLKDRRERVEELLPVNFASIWAAICATKAAVASPVNPCVAGVITTKVPAWTTPMAATIALAGWLLGSFNVA